MNIPKIREELKKARGARCFRAAFGSIVRRNYDEINNMTPGAKKQFVQELGESDNYYTELYKELAGVKYDKQRGHI